MTDDRPGRYRSFDLLSHGARAAEVSGFDGVVLPFDPAGEEPLVAAASLAGVTSRLQVTAGVPTSLATPVYVAKLAVTFQRWSGDRLGWWIDADGPGAGPAYGDHLEGADRHERDLEFLRVARAVFSTSPLDHRGRFFTVEGGGFAPPLSGRPFPAVAVAGASERAVELAAAVGDRLVAPGLRSGDEVADLARRLRERAAAAGRRADLALELAVVAREDRDEAVAAAGGADAAPGAGAAPGSDIANGAGAAGQTNAAAGAADARARRNGVSANGAGGDPGAPGVLVGSYREVAARLVELRRAGAAAVVLRLDPVVEELYRFGHFVRPWLEDEVARHVA
ncbi:MAG TPA: LLM class flavin-dependent oxidoreductase [Acidimicrobiales bacterium]